MKLQINNVRTRTESRSILGRAGRIVVLGISSLVAACSSNKPEPEKPAEIVVPAPETREIPVKLVENRCTAPEAKEDVIPNKFASPKDVIRALAGYKDAKVVREGAGKTKVYSVDPLPEPASNGICIGGVNLQIVSIVYTDGKRAGYSDGDSVSMMIKLIAPAEEATPEMGAAPQDFLNGRLGLVPVAVNNEKFWMLQADVEPDGKITHWMNVYLPSYPFGQMLARVAEDDTEQIKRFDIFLTAANEVLRKLPSGKKS